MALRNSPPAALKHSPALWEMPAALKNGLLLALCLLLFCSTAGAQLLVGIYPKDISKETMELYLDEVAEFEMLAYNAGALPLEGVVLKASLPQQLAIVGDEQKHTLTESIESLLPTEKKRFFLELKMLVKTKGNAPISIHYGTETYTHAVTTYLEFAESPLLIEAGLEREPTTQDPEGTVLLRLENTSEQELRNLRAALEAGKGIQVESTPLSLLSLSPEESIDETRFSFRLDPNASGERALRLLVSFEDAKGKHVIEKRFAVNPPAKSSDLLLPLIAGIILLLVLVAILSLGSRGKKKQLEKAEKKVAKELAKQPAQQ